MLERGPPDGHPTSREATMTSETCRACNSRDLYATRVDARGGHGPDLLPGLRLKWWKGAQFEVTVCNRCGHADFSVPAEYRARIPAAKTWRRKS
jgi:Zn ribbon nucleic-acid-binding protein